MRAAMTDRSKGQAPVGIEVWRVRIYSAGFLVAFILHLLADGFWHWFALSAMALIAISLGIWNERGLWLRAGVMLGVLHALIFPIFQQALADGDGIAATVVRVPLWPQLLVTLIGSRVLASEGKLSFIQFWRRPIHRHSSVEMQSVGSAIVLGAFLTIVFYMVVPYALHSATKQTSNVIVSAMLGRTIIHTAIIFLFFVILSSIFDAALLYVNDRSILAWFDRLIEGDRKAGFKRDPISILDHDLSAVAYSRAFRLLKAATETKEMDDTSAAKLATLSFDGFQIASRQFVRALLPFLPLLGFLGTVIGLATAISELPQGLMNGPGQGADFSASLAGLAIKFETTLLGLIASMICSLLLNFLEKREAELAAECMLVVKAAGERNV